MLFDKLMVELDHFKRRLLSVADGKLDGVYSHRLKGSMFKKLSGIHTIILFICYHNILHFDTELSIPDFSTTGVLQMYSNQPRSMNQL